MMFCVTISLEANKLSDHDFIMVMEGWLTLQRATESV
jgi:hypothetical protein